MATLVLSTVGTVLGGPIGGAIGSLVGQSIDQQIFAPKMRGPRLGNLSVQTSSYGTQIPRVYGTMRVAGSVIWSTDLVESSTSSGVKGQPSQTISYSVSFAVALSSRPLAAIRRIWADGKLLRGASGDFKVSCGFRFHNGSEAQKADPLIASAEGIASTPAYRGIALAVFENLDLSPYGNRIPFLTFEACADEADPTIASILADASDGRIDCEAGDQIGGYAAFGKSILSAVEPLVETFSIPLVDDGVALRSPVNSSHVIDEAELGSSGNDERFARMERERAPARETPARLTLSFYDPDRDYQTGLASTNAFDSAGVERPIELPAVLSATRARTLAEASIARCWAQRDTLVVRLGPKRLGLQPGETLVIEGAPVAWEVRRRTIEAMTVIAELRPSWSATATIAADPGRSNPDADVVAGPLTLALIDVPYPSVEQTSDPMLYLAAGNASAGWKNGVVDVTSSGFATTLRTARKSVMGTAATVLPVSQSALIDLESVLDVQLFDPEQWLTSCDDNALAEGANLALLGQELLQFGEATPLGGGRFRLKRFLRARFGTEWAMGSHNIGETFVLFDTASLVAFRVPALLKGATVTATGGQTSAVVVLNCESLRPPSPVDLVASFDANGELVASWTRRSRAGWYWLDEIDAPLGEQFERYGVEISGSAGTFETECNLPNVAIASGDLAGLGGGPAMLTIRQIGDWAASHPAEIGITLP